MKRRNLAMGGLALASLTTGAWWRGGREAASQSAGALQDGADLWALRFDKPGGGELRLADFKGQALVLNFWGSWCPPCVAEMPDLDQFASEFGPQGWRVVGLAVDNPKAVLAFLANKPVAYAIGLAGFEGATLARNLGNAQGGLPYTVVLNRNGQVALRKAGAASFAEMRGWATKA